MGSEGPGHGFGSGAERDIDDLPRNDANYTALTPLWFLERAALAQPDRASVVHGPVRYTWAETYRRCRRLASALARRSVGHGSTVAVIAPNVPAVYEAHFGVPMSGAVVNCVNIRLNAETIAFLLNHSMAEVVMVDQEFFTLAEESLKIVAEKKKRDFKPPILIVIGDPTCDPKSLEYALGQGVTEYEEFLKTGDPEFNWKPPKDEWQSIALGYTSGTTSSPKGVVLHHRGAYLMALSVAMVWGMPEGAIYLWTLPMFHCNGWCYTWALAAFCGTSICLRQVAVIAPNIPAIYEAHFGVPMAGAVVNCVNIRLNAPTVAFLLEHSSAEVVMVDQEFFSLAVDSLRIIADQKKGSFKQPLVIVIGDHTCDPSALQDALRTGAIEYEKFLETGDPEFAWKPPQDEWKSIALGYTSGTTSNPKGVVLHHRGAYLMSLSGALVWKMNDGAVYLWTLPMFHCNGWCYTWTLAAICGTSICLRQVTAKAIFSAIANQGVTHFCGAPVVLNTIINAPPSDTILPLPRVVDVMTAGAAPPPSVLASMSKLGFRVAHTYGLSETYGPSTVCAWKPEWDILPDDERARLQARQGIRYVGLEGLDVVDPKSMEPVPADGSTLGEIVMRGNAVMKGYLKNPKANAEAFENGWFHSGDLGVRHPDGYIEVKDRAKDIIISGGENISSLEVEKAVYMHPAVLEASVVARADEQWGESPCAFVTLKDGVDGSNEAALAGNIMRFCRERLPGYWVPKSVVFGPLPKTATGKIKKHELRAKAKELGPVRKSRM